jgi:hypothetical protein
MRRIALICVFALTAVPSTPTAAGTPVFASDNVSLVNTIPIEGTAIGGKLRIVDGHPYFVMTATTGVSIYDVATPELPLPVAHLPLGNFENEDVEMSDDLLLIANDQGFTLAYGGLQIIDISNPPVIGFAYENVTTQNRFQGSFTDPEGQTFNYRGGHTVSCVPAAGNECAYAYATGPGGGSRQIFIIDIRTPSQPVVVNAFESPVRGTHDVKVDADGYAWFVGSGGIAAYDVTDPANPALLSVADPDELDYVHSSLRRGDTLLITEENYVTASCTGEGRFATADTSGFASGSPVRILDRWTTELDLGGAPGTTPAGTYTDGNQVTTGICSAHWFDERNGVVAIGWYQQGVRLLDVSDPDDIRQTGYFVTPNSLTWDAQWITDDVVYAIDNARGIDVLVIDGGLLDAPTVRAPVLPGWRRSTAATAGLAPHPQWGYACPIVAA